ncbi:hypothetical protein C8R47DRAFT_1302401 [Mycena vitilis]|nr:hypothetical protein C8R47DRAFT_1302401 [Mycena vitilis]
MRALSIASKNLGPICARERWSLSFKVIVRHWHRIARVGQAKGLREREESLLVLPIPESVAHSNFLGRRIEFFRVAGYIPTSTPFETPHAGLPLRISRPSCFTPAHNVRGFRSSAVSALEETAPAPRRARGSPWRDAVLSAPPDSPADALTAAKHDDARRRPRRRQRRDAAAAAAPVSSDDPPQGEKHADAPRRPRGRPRRDGAPPPPGSPSKPCAASVLPALPTPHPQSQLDDPIGLWDDDESDWDSDSEWDPAYEIHIGSDSDSDAESESESAYESDVVSQLEDSENESDSHSESDSESDSGSDSEDELDADYAPDRRPRWEEALAGNINAWRR